MCIRNALLLPCVEVFLRWPYHFKALTIREKVLGTEHPDTATSYNNIGSVYYAQSDYDKALEYFNKACSTFEIVFGLEHPNTKVTLDWINSVIEAMKSSH